MSAQVNPRLIVNKGPSSGQEYELTLAEVVIGRSTAADLTIDVSVVSRRHVRLTRVDGRYHVEDLGSSNGTYLNGERLLTVEPLSSGDRISLGHEVLLIFDDPAEPIVETTLADDFTELEIDQTMIETDIPDIQLEELKYPQLSIRVADSPPQTITLTGDQLTIGRSDDNDIVIPSPVVSRHHAVLERVGEGYRLILLPETKNPFLFQGTPVGKQHRLHDGDELRIDSPSADMVVTLTYQSLAEASLPSTSTVAAIRVASTEPHSVARGDLKPTDQTMLDMDFAIPGQTTPPQLVVTVAGSPPETYSLIRDQITIGRAEDNDIVIQSRIVSRHHARLEKSDGGYQLVVLPDTVNQLLCQGRPITGRYNLRQGDILRIDSTIPGMMVTMTYRSTAEALVSKEYHTIVFGEKSQLTFGRDPGNEVILDFPTVSRYHAQVERVGRRYRVVDLRSANGTFVNDVRVEGDVWLEPQDTLRIGPYRFVMGQDAFTQYDESTGLRVQAYGLNKWVRKDLNILEDISLVFQPREFVVVVGQSGGGKSTLLDAIAGYRPATDGQVMVNGIDVYRNFDVIRNEIGYVPQRDIIHMELTVYQALDYAAKLRMPGDTSKDERHQRIMEVLEDLDLTHRKDVQISGLSGGQQKRVSIGVELLTKPGLFFLDEPTSGLDPGTETAFMHLMRRLADQGRTIILVTHATKNVMLADKVVFLARGGYLAWFGPPDEALQYFDQYRSERDRRTREMEFDQIYAILDDTSKGSPQEWAARFQAHPAYQQYIVQPLKTADESLPLISQAQQAQADAPRRQRSRSGASSLRQFMILSARNIRILTRDRTSLILMLVAAPLVGMLDLVIAPLMGRAPYDYISGDAANASVTLFLLTIYCLLVGGLAQMREIVKEGDIYKRERLVNLKIFPYVASKIWVAVILALYQAVAYTVIRYIAFDMPGGALEFGLIYITLFLAVTAGMVGGLLASAISPAASAAPLIMILLIVPQIVLSGALAPVPGYASAIASTRWGYEALIGITGMGSDVAADPCWKLSDELREGMTLEDKDENNCLCMGTNVFDPNSCNYPGIGQYYEPEVDQDPPVEPPELAEKPTEPEIPPAPETPDDQTDQVAVVQYLNALETYQEDVERIQSDYKNRMELYEAQAEVYQAEMASYQEAYAEWNIARNSAVQSAEAVIGSHKEEFGWAWVNKSDPAVFWSWMFRTWIAQGVIISVYILLILFLMKRKDVS
jgi:ABC-type multidrug transport system ATPase subunit/pSer/pThr/pTyr-binding forkhead associated (FHA) protein